MAEIVTTSPISAYDFSASMGWMLVASFSGELPDLWWALRVSLRPDRVFPDFLIVGS